MFEDGNVQEFRENQKRLAETKEAKHKAILGLVIGQRGASMPGTSGHSLARRYPGMYRRGGNQSDSR